MLKICRRCNTEFEITDDDLRFYDRVSTVIHDKKLLLPPPTLCPDCRQMRRLAFRNERYLFKRTCDLCKKPMIAMYDENTPFPVYCVACWWSDVWDPLSYGREYDPTLPFFKQMKELLDVVPKPGMLQLNNENSEYNSLLAYSKNTYMSAGSYFLEDCYYVRKSQYSKDCLNCNMVDHSELLSFSVNCKECYNCHCLINCRGCRDSRYLADCTGCKNCFMCSGLVNKKFQFKNKQLTEEEYAHMVADYTGKSPNDLLKEFSQLNVTIPKKFQNQINCEHSSGDYIQSCKNAIECYDCFDIEDAKYLIECVNVKDSMDLCMHDKDIELCYELCSGGENNTNLKFSFCSCDSPYSEYVHTCFYLSDSFGCNGIHQHESNCILNKKYSKVEYDALKEKIIVNMMEAEEYGEFFPISLSTHPYNDTYAFDYFPISEDEAIKKAYNWRKIDKENYNKGIAMPFQQIDDVRDDIITTLFSCALCCKNFKVIEQELLLSKKLGVCLSPYCPDCRFQQLDKQKNPRKLWKRTCQKCGKAIETTYAPERPETVYCEECYLKEVY